MRCAGRRSTAGVPTRRPPLRARAVHPGPSRTSATSHGNVVVVSRAESRRPALSSGAGPLGSPGRCAHRPTQTGCDGRRPPGPLPGRRRPCGGPRRRSRPGPARRPRARPTTMVRDMGYPLEGCMISLVAGPGSEEGPLVPLKNRPAHVACQAPRGRRRTKKGRDHGSRGRMESGSVTVSSRRRLPPARPGFRPCPGAHSRCCPSAWTSTRCRP